MWRVACVLAFLAIGCAHPAAGETGLAKAYQKVATGSHASARGGGYLVERSGDSLRVVRETPIGGLGQNLSDAAITNEVNNKLEGRKLGATTQDGMVTLKGSAGSRAEAMQAIKDTLSLDGVTAVRSQIRF